MRETVDSLRDRLWVAKTDLTITRNERDNARTALRQVEADLQKALRTIATLEKRLVEALPTTTR